MLLVSLSCTRPGGDGLFEKAEGRGVVPPELEEASALVASYGNPDMLWTLNDSGNPAEIFLIDDRGAIVMACTLQKVKNRDWEDIAIGPGPGRSKYLYIGEVGDNEAKYDYKYLYRLAEPTFRGERGISIEKFDILVVSLPDGKRDMEAIAIDQATGDLYLISKREEQVHLYRSPAATLVPGDTLVPEKVCTLPFHNVVAADFSPDAKELLVKTYDEIHYWPRPDSLSIPQVLQTTPISLAYKREPQGEAIAWALDGMGFYTLSESVEGQAATLYFYKKVK